MGLVASCLSNIMYLSEKLTLWLTCVGLISCIVLMFIVTLGMGIGLGYNYCFVDMKTKYKYVPGHYVYPGSPRWPRQGSREENNEAEETLPVLEPKQEEILRNQFPPDLASDYFEKKGETPKYPAFDDLDTANDTDTTNDTVALKSDTVIPLDDKDSNDTTTEISETTIDEGNFKNTSISRLDTETEGTDIDEEHREVSPTPSVNIVDPNSRRVKKLVIPISGLDLISLLSKLRAENKNYSLQIVTT